VEGNDGNFYGTTLSGGEAGEGGLGTVFRISPVGGYTILYSFGSYPHDGELPVAALVQGSDSNFYGTTLWGGTSTNCDTGCGTVFRISPDGIYTTLHSFAGFPSDGADPSAGLVQGSDSNFYGTTSQGGMNGQGFTNGTAVGYGTVFSISPSGGETILYSFGQYYTTSAGLVQGSDSNFYGTTVQGGSGRCVGGCGTVFRISPTVGYTSLYSFADSDKDGAFPSGTLVQGSDGNFYGTTEGGRYGKGSVFELTLGGDTGGCTYTLNTTSFTLAAKGGSETVRVKVKGTDCAWTASSNDPFIMITSGSGGTLKFTVLGNTNTMGRSGTMTIAGQTFTVAQAAASCEFSLGETEARFGSAGGSSNVAVTANGTNCMWTAAVSGSFIQISPDTSATGSGAVDYIVEPNTKTATRKGTITVGKEKLTITQSGVAP
jgi:uncharacterized repeat protein (TIGR03803 family)